MKPDFRLLADDREITEGLRDRLLDLRLTDEAPTEDDPTGFLSDSLELRLDDRPPGIELPRHGAGLTVLLGYRGSELLGFGRYTVDEVALSGPPATLTVRARAADLRGSLKAPRTRSFDGVTVGELVAAIASEHGYRPQVAPEFAGEVLPHLDQTRESDLHLLTRLSSRLGAAVKPAGGKLLLVSKGAAKRANGSPVPPVELAASVLTHWEVTQADRMKYGAVKAHYRDLNAAELKTLTVGKGTPAYELRHVYHDVGHAKSAARAKLEELKRGAAVLSFSLPGDPRLTAETRVTLSGVRPGVDGVWTLSHVTHTLGSSGYKTDCRAHEPKGAS